MVSFSKTDTDWKLFKVDLCLNCLIQWSSFCPQGSGVIVNRLLARYSAHIHSTTLYMTLESDFSKHWVRNQANCYRLKWQNFFRFQEDFINIHVLGSIGHYFIIISISKVFIAFHSQNGLSHFSFPLKLVSVIISGGSSFFDSHLLIAALCVVCHLCLS